MMKQIKLPSLLKIYQIGLKTSTKSKDCIFDCVHLLYCKCQKVNLNPGGSYIHFPGWIKNKRANINLVNDDDKCS